MAKKSRASFVKRQKELARQEKQREKQARRLLRARGLKSTAPAEDEDRDPGIAAAPSAPPPPREDR